MDMKFQMKFYFHSNTTGRLIVFCMRLEVKFYKQIWQTPKSIEFYLLNCIKNFKWYKKCAEKFGANERNTNLRLAQELLKILEQPKSQP